jgi:DNA (cytosine-5)-methyltransferase 1
LDAQYFGLAQRRRRVFVVASARNDFDPAKVLFEFDGMRRDTAPSRQARQGVAGGVEIGPGGGRLTDLNPTLDTRAKDGPIRNQLAGAVLTMAHGQGGAEIATDRAPTLTCNHEAPIAVYPTGEAPCAFCGHPFDQEALGRYGCPNCEGEGLGEPIAFHPTQDPISSTDGTTHGLGCGSSGRQASVAVAQPMPINTWVALRHEALGEGTGFGIGAAGDPAYTLTKGHSHAVAISLDQELNGRVELAGTLQRKGEGGVEGSVMTPAMAVRRLTPVECERLQGFPDTYTNIPWRNKPEAPDGPRYKALGNSWAVPNVRWIGQRIARALR